MDALIGVYLFFRMKIYLKIQKKDPSFLRYYHTFSIVTIILSFLGSLLSEGFWKALLSLLISVLGVYLVTLYFTRSVRVRTYMGSEEYLRLSYFTRNTPSPVPADQGDETGDMDKE